MDSKSKGLIATIAAVVLCGCPGVLLCIVGALGASGTPFNTTVNDVSSSAPMPFTAAAVLLCLAVILMVIPVVVAFLTLRSRPAPTNLSEPIPPAS